MVKIILTNYLSYSSLFSLFRTHKQGFLCLYKKLNFSHGFIHYWCDVWHNKLVRWAWIKMSSTKYKIEKFTSVNDFGLWRLNMQILLVQQGLLEALKGSQKINVVACKCGTCKYTYIYLEVVSDKKERISYPQGVNVTQVDFILKYLLILSTSKDKNNG